MDNGLNLDGGMLQRIPPTASKEEQTAVLNDIIDRLNNLLKSQVFSDGTNKRMLIGYQKDGWGSGNDFGIKVSRPGVDVTAATDEQLLFRMSTDNWSWRNNDGDLVQEFNVSTGVINYRNSNNALVRVYDITRGTTYEYDPSTGINFMQIGKLPDNSYGWVVAAPGYNVADLYS